MRAEPTGLRMQRPGLGPVDVEGALCEQPGTVALDERVAVAKPRDHQRALALVGEQVVRDAVALAGRPVAVERDGALAI